jgi:molybdopterin converting factor small subunit
MTFEGGLYALRDAIEARYSGFSRYNYQLSVNRLLVREDVKLKEGDEIAFMPPFAGG